MMKWLFFPVFSLYAKLNPAMLHSCKTNRESECFLHHFESGSNFPKQHWPPSTHTLLLYVTLLVQNWFLCLKCRNRMQWILYISISIQCVFRAQLMSISEVWGIDSNTKRLLQQYQYQNSPSVSYCQLLRDKAQFPELQPAFFNLCCNSF